MIKIIFLTSLVWYCWSPLSWMGRFMHACMHAVKGQILVLGDRSCIALTYLIHLRRQQSLQQSLLCFPFPLRSFHIPYWLLQLPCISLTCSGDMLLPRRLTVTCSSSLMNWINPTTVPSAWCNTWWNCSRPALIPRNYGKNMTSKLDLDFKCCVGSQLLIWWMISVLCLQNCVQTNSRSFQTIWSIFLLHGMQFPWMPL